MIPVRGRSAVDAAQAGFIGTAPLAPLPAAAVAFVAYLLNIRLGPAGTSAFILGLVALVTAWTSLALGYIALGFTDVRHANASAYCDLQILLTEVHSEFDTLIRNDGREFADAARERNRHLLERYVDVVEFALQAHAWSRAVWVLGTGYVNARKLIHRSQEALVALESIKEVAQRAKIDLMRLAGSGIENREAYRRALTGALELMDSVMKGDLDVNVANRQEPTDTFPIIETISSGETWTPGSIAEARLVVSTLRRVLNEFRDESRAGLVWARNRMAVTTTVNGILAYAVLMVAIGAGAPAMVLQSAIAYSLIGALIGLFVRQYSEFGTDTAVDDYGVFAMQLIAALQLSGIAAVLGVGLLAVTGITGSLEAAFKLPPDTMNVLTAGIFAVTPQLLIHRLNQQTEVLKGNLRNSEPMGGSRSRN